jgi:hypothetical protein
MAILSILFLLETVGVQAENLALNKPYEMSLAPNYGLCTDSGDTTQLTDGKMFGADWNLSSTVGWSSYSRVTITLDFGKVSPIGKVRIHTIGGGQAGVYLPVVTGILVSEDGTSYSLITGLSSGMIEQNGKTQVKHTFETTDLNVLGQYVRLVFQTEERYLFLDEIEVLPASQDVRKATKTVTDAEMESLFKNGLQARWLVGEWKDIRKQIKTMSGDKLLTPIRELDVRMGQLNISDSKAIEDIQRDVLVLRADAARNVFDTQLIVQPLASWSELRGTWFPTPKSKAISEIDLPMWQDEYESRAFGITNIAKESERVVVNVSALKDKSGKAVSWDKRLWLRQVRPIQTRIGYRVMDALTLLGQGDKNRAEFTLGTGESLMLWITAYSVDLAPGEYQAQLQIQSGQSEKMNMTLPLTITVAPLRIPQAADRMLREYNWEYLEGWNPPEGAAQDLRAHGVNTFILHPSALPQPIFNADRTKLESVDFRIFDKALAKAENPVMHGVFWGAEGPSLFKLDQPGERELFKQWIRIWAKHLEEKGYGPERYFIYPYDECIPKEFVRIAQLIKEADSRLQVYCNCATAPIEDIKAIAPYINIWCPLATDFPNYGGAKAMSKEKYDVFCALQKQYNFTLWTYDCDGPSELLPADTYYRQIAWCAFDNNATGMGFYCYAPTSNTWDKYSGAVHYELVYYGKDAPAGVTQAEAIIPSRRWEAVREATEDYEYLHRLQETIDRARKAGVKQDSLNHAQHTLQRVVRDVLANPTLPDRYDRARRDLTQAILELSPTVAP